MQKWEYLQLTWMYEGGNQRLFAVNGQFKHDWNGQPLHLVMNQLGNEGWELTAYEHSSRELIFKRPKA
jgi:hypothetical protein